MFSIFTNNPWQLLRTGLISLGIYNGSDGNDTLKGTGKDDTLYGGNGSDNLFGEDGNDYLYGETGIDKLYGGNGNDFLDGGSSGDYMEGGSGDDFYVVDNSGDQVVETSTSPGGIDTVYSTINYNLTDYVENLIFLGGANFTGIGNTLNNLILGSYTGANTLYGVAGNDTIFGGAITDYLFGGDGNDSLMGLWGVDALSGEGGNDSLDGGDGDDNLNGGAGNNTLNGGAGFDRVVVSGDRNYTLTNTQLLGEGIDTLINIEGVNITGGGSGNNFNTTGFTTGSLFIYGRGGNDTISAGASADQLYGDEGSDTIDAGAGNDYLFGGEGNDSLTGGAGVDALVGEGGNDTLNGGDGDDNLDGGAGSNILNGGAGFDTVGVSGDRNYTLTNTQLLGEGTDTLIGIEAANLTGGGSGNNFNTTGFTTGSVFIYGRAGNDIITTGASADQLYGDEGSDTINGGAATDYLFGGEGNDSLIGGAGIDALLGEGGNDTLYGGAELDNLTGGGGSDLFGFTTPTEGSDLISDFAPGIDKIGINRMGFGGGLVSGPLPSSNFVLGKSAVNSTTRFIYDKSTGALFFDADGTGAGVKVQFASLSNLPALTAGDILVI